MTVSKLTILNILHVANDGFEAVFFLFLPFLAASLGISMTQIGSLGTYQGIIGMLITLPAGYLSLRFGYMRTLLIGMILYITAFFLLGISTSFYWLIPIYTCIGLGFGMFHPIAFASVAKIGAQETRGRRMGDFTALGDLGKIGFSSVVTFIIAAIGWRNTAFLYTFIGATTLLVVAFIYRHHKRMNIQAVSPKSAEQPASYRHLFKNKRFLLYTISSAFDGFSSTHLFVFLPFLLLSKNIQPTVLGAFTGIFFLGSFFGKTLIGRFSDRFGSINLFIMADSIMAIIIVILAASTSVPLIIVLSGILGLLTRGTVPAVKVMVAESLKRDSEFEKGYALNAFLNSTVKMSAPIIIGFTADHYGIVNAFNLLAATVVFAVIPAIISKFMKFQPVVA